jgi:ParB-like chromosome segregation protein Spo0J
MKTYRYSGDAQLIPIGLIHPSNMTGRGGPKLPRLQQVRDKLASDAELHPVAIFIHEGEYLLADGMHRYTAAKEAGMTHLPCVVWEPAWEINRGDWD